MTGGNTGFGEASAGEALSRGDRVVAAARPADAITLTGGPEHVLPLPLRGHSGWNTTPQILLPGRGTDRHRHAFLTRHLCRRSADRAHMMHRVVAGSAANRAGAIAVPHWLQLP